MKKRKPPIILASFLIILVGGSIAFNPLARKTADPTKQPPAEQPQTPGGEPPKVDAPRQPEASGTTMDKMKESMKQGSTPPRPGGPPSTDPAFAPSVHLKKPATTSTAPVQDPNRISGQWYR